MRRAVSRALFVFWAMRSRHARRIAHSPLGKAYRFWRRAFVVFPFGPLAALPRRPLSEASRLAPLIKPRTP